MAKGCLLFRAGEAVFAWLGQPAWASSLHDNAAVTNENCATGEFFRFCENLLAWAKGRWSGVLTPHGPCRRWVSYSCEALFDSVKSCSPPCWAPSLGLPFRKAVGWWQTTSWGPESLLVAPILAPRCNHSRGEHNAVRQTSTLHEHFSGARYDPQVGFFFFERERAKGSLASGFRNSYAKPPMPDFAFHNAPSGLPFRKFGSLRRRTPTRKHVISPFYLFLLCPLAKIFISFWLWRRILRCMETF